MRRAIPLSFSGPYLPSAVQRHMPPLSPRNRRKNSLSFHHWPTMIGVRFQENEPMGNRPFLLDEDSQVTSTNSKEFLFELPTVQASEDSTPPKTTIIQDLVQKIGMPTDAILLLNLVAIIWGSQHAIIKICISDIDPSTFSLVRFFFGALLATPAWLSSSGNSSRRKENEFEMSSKNSQVVVRWGLEMGFWMFLGYAFQSIGLGYTTALRSGFLLYLNVKFVPFFAFLLFRRQISASTWISAGTALFGTALLASDGDNTVSWNVGDLWSVAAAAASAMYILRLESATKAVPNAAALNAACLWVVTGASVFWSAYLGRFQVDTIVSTMLSHPLELLYLSAVTTTIANWIQTKAQKKVTAERASVIYAMDPVWGAIWANILLGETLTGMGLLGALLITAAAATNAFLDFGRGKSSDEN